MKKKKLSKLIKKSILDGFRAGKPMTKKSGPRPGKYSVPEPGDSIMNEELFSESNEESKSKIRNLITRIAKYRDQLEYNINSNSINITTCNVLKTTGNKFDSNYYLNMQIIKGVGFILNFNEKRVLMKDLTLYDEMKEEIRKVSNNLNLENFTELYNVIMKENGLSRESNLDDILKEL